MEIVSNSYIGDVFSYIADLWDMEKLDRTKDRGNSAWFFCRILTRLALGFSPLVLAGHVPKLDRDTDQLAKLASMEKFTEVSNTNITIRSS